jgi:hypothetical protein
MMMTKMRRRTKRMRMRKQEMKRTRRTMTKRRTTMTPTPRDEPAVCISIAGERVVVSSFCSCAALAQTLAE